MSTGQSAANVSADIVRQRLRDEIEHTIEKLSAMEEEWQVFQRATNQYLGERVDVIVELRQRLGAML